MRTLVIGAGEVGSSLARVLAQHYETEIIDKTKKAKGKFNVMHICFPYSDKFKEYVLEYYKEYKPKFVVIHSTVPVGTTKEFDNKVFAHSPIRGKHPDLQKSITTFAKFVGINNYDLGKHLKSYFVLAGIPARTVFGSCNTELGKILSTTKYGHDIIFMKEVQRLCKELGADFNNVYTQFTRTYNEGYDELSSDEFSKFHRPLLEYMPGEIGGHCVVQNCDLLNDELTEYVKNKNASYTIL